MSKKIKLTITIPTYNRAKQLKETLLNIFPQLTEEVRILIIDNASEYDIEEMVSNICPKEHLNKLKIIRNKYNVGMGANFVKCFEYTNTEWMWLLADDDIVLSNAIQIILSDVNRVKSNVALLKYSSPIYSENKDLEVIGLESVINFIAETVPEQRFGNFLFISNSIYRISKMKEFISKGYQYAGTFASQIVILFYYLNKYKNDSVYFFKKELVHLEEIRETYSGLNVGLGIMYSSKNIFFDISYDADKKMRKFFTLFTSSIRNNFLELYYHGYKNNLIKDYKKIFKDLYKYSKCNYTLKEKLEFSIFYLIIDKPLFIEVIKKINKKFRKSIESYNKKLDSRI